MAYRLALLCVLFGRGMAFLPTSSPIFTTETHTFITENAILREAAEACEAVAQAQGQDFSPPLELTPEGVLASCLGVQDGEEGVSASQFRTLLDEIIGMNVLVDRDQQSSPASHFHDEEIVTGRDLITEGRVVIRESLRQNNLQAARRRLGTISHILQDFYSHSNWIDLGNTNTYANLLRPDLPLENLTDAETQTCSLPNIILPDILSTQRLTSGYLASLGVPPGKCGHRSDSSPGIDKDFPESDLPPGATDLHLAAAIAAERATGELLRSIRNSAGDDSFLRMLGLTRSSVVCFVIDTTGSMRDDVAEVRRVTNEIVDRTRGTQNEPAQYILVEFNDPGLGPVHRTTDGEAFKEILAGLRVSGGGDIPELSLGGLQLALTTAPPSSDIFVFTDAPAKDTDLEGAVRSLIDSTNSRVTFFLTNLLPRRTRRSVVTNPVNSLYQELAQTSGGLAIEVTKDTLPQATGVILDSITSSLVNLLQISRDPGSPENFSFLVDPSVQNVTIYITGLSVSFTLISPSGASQESAMPSGPLAVVSEVGNLRTVHLTAYNQTGLWRIGISSTRPYEIRVTGRSRLDFSFQFVELFQGPHPGFVEIEGRPPAGENATIVVRVTGAGSLSGLELLLVDVGGAVVRNTTVESLGRGAFLVSAPRIPDSPFRLQLRGENDGQPFQRQAPNQLQASRISVQIQRTATLEPGVPFSIPFTVTTSGSVSNITVRVQADRDFLKAFTPSEVTVDGAGSVNGSLDFLAPRTTPSGSASTVTIEAKSASTGQSNYALLLLSVIRRVTDFTPPVCRVLNVSGECPIPCTNATWEISLVLSDGNGTGIERVFTRGAPGNLTLRDDKDESGANITVASFITSCCEESVDFVAVDMAGNAGVCSFRIRTPTPTTTPTSPTTTTTPTPPPTTTPPTPTTTPTTTTTTPTTPTTTTTSTSASTPTTTHTPTTTTTPAPTTATTTPTTTPTTPPTPPPTTTTTSASTPTTTPTPTPPTTTTTTPTPTPTTPTTTPTTPTTTPTPSTTSTTAPPPPSTSTTTATSTATSYSAHTIRPTSSSPYTSASLWASLPLLALVYVTL